MAADTSAGRSHSKQGAKLPRVVDGHFVQVADGVQLHYAECLPPDGVKERGVALLLHGFPDYHSSWQEQLPALAMAGFRAVAPDLRGYGRSSKPPGWQSYGEEALVADVDALARHLSPDQPLSVLVGHDWGGFVAWSAAALRPGLCQRLAILNAPHPVSFMDGLATPKQLLKSWYAFVFQLPWVAEWAISAADYAMLRYILTTDPDQPKDQAELARHVAAFSQEPKSLHSAINYYCAWGRGLWVGASGGNRLVGLARFLAALLPDARPSTDAGPAPTIDIPVFVVWGVRDRYLGTELAEPPAALVLKAKVQLIDATHWVHWDQPTQVNKALVDFLNEKV